LQLREETRNNQTMEKDVLNCLYKSFNKPFDIEK